MSYIHSRGERFSSSQSIWTGSGVHPICYSGTLGALYWGYGSKGMKVTSHVCLISTVSVYIEVGCRGLHFTYQKFMFSSSVHANRT